MSSRKMWWCEMRSKGSLWNSNSRKSKRKETGRWSNVFTCRRVSRCLSRLESNLERFTSRNLKQRWLWELEITTEMSRTRLSLKILATHTWRKLMLDWPRSLTESTLTCTTHLRTRFWASFWESTLRTTPRLCWEMKTQGCSICFRMTSLVT